MYGLIGQMIAVSGEREQLAEILTGMGSMPGCLGYIVANDSTNPDALWVTEVWETSQAHADSLALPEVELAFAQGRPLIADFGSRVETEPIGGIGLG